MKTRKTFLGFAFFSLILILSNTAFSFATWVEFSNPRIEHLNANLYSFRVSVNWGGESYTDPETGTVVDPVLNQLWLPNILGTPVNWTANHSGAFGYSYAGDWYGGIETPEAMGEFGLHGPEFGWDFIPDAPMQSSFTMNYFAFTAWLDYDFAFHKRIEGGSETHTGTFDVMVIPEPATMFLFGLGLIGAAALGQRRRQNNQG